MQVFDADGRFLAEWGERGTEPGQLNGPFGIGLDPDGTLLVAEFDNNRVQRFTPEGEFLDGWGGYGYTPRGSSSGPWTRRWTPRGACS